MTKEKKLLSKEIVVIILLISSVTLMIFIVESLIYYNENQNLNKLDFLSKLFWSFVKSFVINFGLIILYYINKKRVQQNKSVL